MDSKFTEKLGAWLQAKAEDRDLAEGAMLLLQLTGNRIMYNNIMLNPSKHREYLEYQLQKHYNFRVAELTHEQVMEMQTQVSEIAAKRKLADLPDDASGETADKSAFRNGKRADHDRLPAEIQALYVENLSTLRRMREVHLRLRTLSVEGTPCHDSDRYPFLKELIALDKKLKASWEAYDQYKYEKDGEH